MGVVSLSKKIADEERRLGIELTEAPFSGATKKATTKVKSIGQFTKISPPKELRRAAARKSPSKQQLNKVSPKKSRPSPIKSGSDEVKKSSPVKQQLKKSRPSPIKSGSDEVKKSSPVKRADTISMGPDEKYVKQNYTTIYNSIVNLVPTVDYPVKSIDKRWKIIRTSLMALDAMRLNVVNGKSILHLITTGDIAGLKKIKEIYNQIASETGHKLLFLVLKDVYPVIKVPLVGSFGMQSLTK